MAVGAKRPCRYSGCRTLVTGRDGFCDAHKSHANISSRANDSYRGSSTQRGYDYKWQKTSAGYLKHHPFCVSCEAKGVIGVAVELDHIIPIQVAPLRKYDRSNWQGLCKPCHTAKTNRDRVKYGLGRGGIKSL
jgi:5-methylcytosine-specific restriction protein A